MYIVKLSLNNNKLKLNKKLKKIKNMKKLSPSKGLGNKLKKTTCVTFFYFSNLDLFIKNLEKSAHSFYIFLNRKTPNVKNGKSLLFLFSISSYSLKLFTLINKVIWCQS